MAFLQLHVIAPGLHVKDAIRPMAAGWRSWSAGVAERECRYLGVRCQGGRRELDTKSSKRAVHISSCSAVAPGSPRWRSCSGGKTPPSSGTTSCAVIFGRMGSSKAPTVDSATNPERGAVLDTDRQPCPDRDGTAPTPQLQTMRRSSRSPLGVPQKRTRSLAGSQRPFMSSLLPVNPAKNLGGGAEEIHVLSYSVADVAR